MFGYVKVNKMDLTYREYEHYRGYYCGLCKCLKDNHGEISRLSLKYDITFLVLVLTSVYKPKSKVIEEGCITNPFKKKKKIINEITEYAASMNVLLAYYKLEDNLKDDKGLKDIISYNLYKNKLKRAYEKYPKKAEIIKEQLDILHNLEMQKNTNIDLVSNTFRNLTSEIFAYKEDEHTFKGYIEDYAFVWNTKEDIPCGTTVKNVLKGNYRKMNESWGNKFPERAQKIKDFCMNNFTGNFNTTNDIKTTKEVITNTNDEIDDDDLLF
jgi:hypothetical protein